MYDVGILPAVRKALAPMTKIVIAAAAIAALWCGGAQAQNAQRVANCGNGNSPVGAGPLSQDANGNLCVRNGAAVIVPLAVSTVTTAGTAVTALAAGQRTAGGYLVTSNAAGICVSENGTAGTATGYTGSVMTVCVAANQPYNLLANAGAVSVNSTASNVAFSGYGEQ